MRARTENVLLAGALLAVVAFLVSFGLGFFAEPPAATSTATDIPRDFLLRGRPPRVEVLNGSGRAGLARAATDRLRTDGFDVVFIGNADSAYTRSIVLDRVGKIDVAQALGTALNIARVETQIDSALLLEATVVLGKDWQARQQPE